MRWCEIGGGKLSSRMPPLKASGEGSNCAAVFPPLLRTINSEWAFEHSARSSHPPLRGSHTPTLLSISLNDLSRRFLVECNSLDRHLVANGGFLILRLARCVYLHRNSCSTATEVTCTMVSHKIFHLPYFLKACKSNIYELRLSVVLTFSIRYAKDQFQVWNGQQFASIKQLKNAVRNFRYVGPQYSFRLLL